MDGRIYLSDFGLADFPDKEAFTIQGERIGALPTIAPEMKFNADTADGIAADVYSLAKTLWILLTGRCYGFEGQYDSSSINGLGQLNLTVPERNGVLFTTPPPVYLRPLDELLRASTSDLPTERPTINKFVDDLSSWTEIYKDFRKHNPLQWSDFQKKLFPFSVPRRAIWDDNQKIVEILNTLGSLGQLSHMFLPDGGGMDLLGCQIGEEAETIELIVGNSRVYTLKPNQLIFENFDFDLEWNYLRLESIKRHATGLGDVYRGREELVRIEPATYLSRSDWELNERYGNALTFDCRYLEGDFLIVQKTSTYNRISYTYDGRHNQMNTDEFRLYMNDKVDIVKYLRQSEKVLSLAKENNVSIDEFVFHFLDQVFRGEYFDNYRDGYVDKWKSATILYNL